jgi:PIN domain nuclease of toxin-antitoxin system
MAAVAHLDTHIALWLYDVRLDRLSSRQRDLIETCDLRVSEFVRLEMQYLHEIGRIKIAPARILAHLAAHAEVALSACPLHIILDEAMKLSWTRDPFDRMIVSNTLAEKARLITCDEVILKHCRLAIG